MGTTLLRKHVDDVSTYHTPNNGYNILSRGDVLYPEKLSKVLTSKAPQNIYYKGNLALLESKAVGFCGSRNASEKGLETAQDCATQIASKGLAVISGYAAGVDLQAHRAALQAGGNTIFVLPEGMEHFRIKRDLKDVWDWARVLVISQFDPKATWQAYRAMERNNIIVALSDVMIVIEAGEKGGTIEAGRSTIRLKRPLYVVEYENMENAPGNKELLSKGAKKLRKNGVTHTASLKSLMLDVMEGHLPVSTATQPALF